MESDAREFLTRLLETPSPAGYETKGQRVWLDYVESFADEVRTDDYGNAVAVSEGSGDGPEIVLTGHADEIGFIVERIDDDGFVHPGRIGGADPTVSRGQHVTIHSAAGPVEGVIGQDAIHVRDHDGNGGEPEIDDLWIDIGATDEDDARERVEVGDPITFSATYTWLTDDRLAGRGIDNRVGTWAAAEGLRRAVEADAEATVYAVSTVQEELGRQGARMVGYDLAPDAVVAVDVTHALDYPTGVSGRGGEVELGAGPVVARGSANHPVVCQAVRRAASGADLDVQLQATGRSTGTDADSFYTARGGVPSQVVSVPNRYMHTPVEVVDAGDLDEVAALLGTFAAQAHEYDSFAVDV